MISRPPRPSRVAPPRSPEAGPRPRAFPGVWHPPEDCHGGVVAIQVPGEPPPWPPLDLARDPIDTPRTKTGEGGGLHTPPAPAPAPIARPAEAPVQSTPPRKRGRPPRPKTPPLPVSGVRRGQSAIILPPDTVAALHHAARVEGRTVAEVVALALAAWTSVPAAGGG